MNIVKKIFNGIESFLEHVCMFTLVVMVVLIFVQVFCRYILKFTPRWSEETAVILMIWVAFIGMALGVKRGIHLTITFFVELFPKLLKKIILIADELCVMVFGIVIIIYGIDLVYNTMDSTLAATQLPSSVIYAVLPVAGVLIVIYTFARAINLILNKNN